MTENRPYDDDCVNGCDHEKGEVCISCANIPLD